MKQECTIELPDARLGAYLRKPENARLLVLFIHGTGSNSRSPRNGFVAEYLEEHGFASLLFDVLTPEEDENPDNRFDISLMAGRLAAVMDWVSDHPDLSGMEIACFGASTGAAAAFKVARDSKSDIRAIVSRGGRPDLVLSDLRKVRVPSLLIVGGQDYQVRQMNERAIEQMNKPKKLVIVPGATHLFSEEGAMEEVAKHAAEWYRRFVGSGELDSGEMSPATNDSGTG